jgi:hypothetical protein
LRSQGDKRELLPARIKGHEKYRARPRRLWPSSSLQLQSTGTGDSDITLRNRITGTGVVTRADAIIVSIALKLFKDEIASRLEHS